MIEKSLIFCAIICATYVITASAQRYYLRQTSFRFNRRRGRRSALDTHFMDIARKAFISLATEKGQKPNNKFHRAIEEIEKALASRQAQNGLRKHLVYDQKTLAKEFMRILERSAKSGNTESFREVLGRAIFHNMSQIASTAINRNAGVLRDDDTKALLDGAKAFLSDIKQQIGKEHFEELISINGEVIA